MRTGELLVRSDGTTWLDEFLVFEQFTEVCEEAENTVVCLPLSQTSGFAGPGEMDLTVDDRQLASASATATALAQTCVFTEGEIDCGEWHTEHLQTRRWRRTPSATLVDAARREGRGVRVGEDDVVAAFGAVVGVLVGKGLVEVVTMTA